MNTPNRFLYDHKNIPTLDEMCQFLVWSPEDLKELQRILRNAPVTLDKISDEVVTHLAYLLNDIHEPYSEDIDDVGINGTKLSDRKFHRSVEILVDPLEFIPREYESAILGNWQVNNFHGNSTIGKDQLTIIPDVAKNLEIYSDPTEGHVVVVYNQNDLDHIMSIRLFDRDNFRYPITGRKGEDYGGSK